MPKTYLNLLKAGLWVIDRIVEPVETYLPVEDNFENEQVVVKRTEFVVIAIIPLNLLITTLVLDQNRLLQEV